MKRFITLLMLFTVTVTAADKIFPEGIQVVEDVTFIGTGNAGIVVRSLTTGERDALTPANGSIIYNTTTSEVQVRAGGSWIAVGSSVGDVTGPGSSTDNEVPRFDSTTGKIIQAGSGVIIDDSGNITVPGTVDGRDVATDGTKLDGVESCATADQSDAEIETAYNNQVSIVSQVEAEAGTATTVRRWTAERVKQAIEALGGGLSNIVEDVTPQLGADLDMNGFNLNDSNANTVLEITTSVGGAANFIGVQAAAASGNPSVSALGSDTNVDLLLKPKGTGDLYVGLTGLVFDADQTIGAGQDNYVMTYDNGTGLVSLEAAASSGLSNVVEDVTPQLGGNLDLNSNLTFTTDGTEEVLVFLDAGTAVNHLQIRNAATTGAVAIESVGDDTNIGLHLIPKGTGNILIGNDTGGNYAIDADQSVGAGQDNYVMTYDDGTGLVSLEAAAASGMSTTAYKSFAAHDLVARTTNGALPDTQELATNDIMVRSFFFDPSTDEAVQIRWTPPETWDAGTVKFKFKWSYKSGSGDVVWGVTAQSLANDDALDTAFGAVQTVTDTAIAADDEHVTSATAALTVSGSPTAGDAVLFMFYRDADNGSDTHSGDAQLLEVIMQYTADATPSAW